MQDSSLLAFDFAGVHHSDMVTLLAGYGIALRAGQHCAQPLLAALGVSGTLRASFAPTTLKVTSTRWLPPLTAPLNYWWINDEFSFSRTPIRLRYYRRDAKTDLRPAHAVEDKYRQLILLGKQLPALSDDLKSQAKEIAGCENRVWLGFSVSGEKLHFFGDSEGRIVRGLLAVLLTAVEGKSAAELLAQSPLALFDELGLRAQLSASRGQGLIALSDAVQDAARQVQA